MLDPELVSQLTPRLWQGGCYILGPYCIVGLGCKTNHDCFLGRVSQCKNAMFIVFFCCFCLFAIEISAHFPYTLRSVSIYFGNSSSFIPLCFLYELFSLLK